MAMITLMMQEEGWHQKCTVYYCIYVGLFHVRVSHGIVGMSLVGVFETISEQTANGLKSLLLHRDYDIQEFSEFMCGLQIPGITDRMCLAGTYLKFTTWGLLFCWFHCIALLALSMGFMWYYHFYEARTITRQWLWAFQIFQPLLGFMGMMVYGFGTMELD